jgi:transposase InsO family protein
LPQRWPFCWWLAVVVDHFSRRTQAIATFAKEPTANEVTSFLGRAVRTVGTAPRHLICDRGVQFDCREFRRFWRHRKIRPRYGAVGKHGNIAVVERFILTLKQACLSLPLVPLRATTMRRDIASFLVWYNEQRPHTFLSGRTPNEAYLRKFPTHRRPRFEPRCWPRGSPCSRPRALTRGKPAARLELIIELHRGHRHLPLVSLKRAA